MGQYVGSNGTTYTYDDGRKAQLDAQAKENGLEVFFNEGAGGWQLRPKSGGSGGGGKPKPKAPTAPTPKAPPKPPGPVMSTPELKPTAPTEGGGGGGGGGTVNTPSMGGLTDAVGMGSDGSAADTQGAGSLLGPSKFRQGIGQRLQPTMSHSLAALKQIY